MADLTETDSLLFKRFVFHCVINQKSEMGHTSRKLYKRKNSIFAIIFQLPFDYSQVDF